MTVIESVSFRRLCNELRRLLETDIAAATALFCSNGEIWKKIRRGLLFKTLKRLQELKEVDKFHIECGRKTNKNAQRGQAVGWVEFSVRNIPVRIDFDMYLS